MADLKSTIVNGKLRVTSDANVSGNLEGATISENGTQLSDKYQAKLVSGANIKTLNGQTILGSGDLSTDEVGYINLTGTSGDLNDTQFAEAQKEYCIIQWNYASPVNSCQYFYKDNYAVYENYDVIYFSTFPYITTSSGTYYSKKSRITVRVDNKHWDRSDNSTSFYTTGQLDQRLASKLATVNVATVETSTTASKSYVVGDLLICNGTLYKVTSAISLGGTITPGTNVSATTIEELLNNIYILYLDENSSHTLTEEQWNLLKNSKFAIINYTYTKDYDTYHENFYRASFNEYEEDYGLVFRGNVYKSAYGIEAHKINIYMYEDEEDGSFHSGWSVYLSDDIYNFLRNSNITIKSYSGTILVSLSAGELVFYNNILYRALTDIPSGTTPVISGVNRTLDEVRLENLIPKIIDSYTDRWETASFPGLGYFNGQNVWKDPRDETTYYSNGSTQKVFNKATGVWENKSWSRYSNIFGNNVWFAKNSFGTTFIFYSNGTIQKRLYGKYESYSNDSWSDYSWSGISNFYGKNVWTDGTNTYMSDGTNQYILDVTSNPNSPSWVQKTWDSQGYTNIIGEDVWLAKGHIYFSNGTSQYELINNKWEAKTWNGGIPLFGHCVWYKENKVYYSEGSTQLILDTSGTYISNWSSMTWLGTTSFYGNTVWTDGTYYYCYNNNVSYRIKIGIRHFVEYLNKVAETGSYNDLKDKPGTETWTFTMADGTVVTKKVLVKS